MISAISSKFLPFVSGMKMMIKMAPKWNLLRSKTLVRSNWESQWWALQYWKSWMQKKFHERAMQIVNICVRSCEWILKIEFFVLFICGNSWNSLTFDGVISDWTTKVNTNTPMFAQNSANDSPNTGNIFFEERTIFVIIQWNHKFSQQHANGNSNCWTNRGFNNSMHHYSIKY